MAHPLVGDVANVVRIETLRSTPPIVDGSTNAKPALDRTLSLRPGFLESSPAKLLPETARLCGLWSAGSNPLGYEFATRASLHIRGATVLMSLFLARSGAQEDQRQRDR